MGGYIYPNNLLALHVPPINSSFNAQDYYLSESIFDVYYPVLLYLQNNISHSVKIFPAHTYILSDTSLASRTDICNVWEQAVKYFLRHDILGCDVVVFPLIKHSHCTTVMLFKKQKFVLFLDSIRSKQIAEDEILLLFKVIAGVYAMFNLPFRVEEWTVYAPQDVPTQNNSFDCGVFCCMFVEVLITGERRDFSKENVTAHRSKIYNTLKTSMHESIPGPQLHSYDKRKIKLVEVSNILLPPVQYTSPATLIGKTNTIEFLRDILECYWEERTNGE